MLNVAFQSISFVLLFLLCSHPAGVAQNSFTAFSIVRSMSTPGLNLLRSASQSASLVSEIYAARNSDKYTL